MSLTESQMAHLGTDAPAFDLPAANPDADARPGNTRSLSDFADADVLVVVFTCNHCPYAQHVEPALIELAEEYQPHGVAFAAISANDPETHPEDSFSEMAARAEAKGSALDDLLEHGEVRTQQHPSIGCNIKWKPGMAPA
ncbi:MAG: thioredoxin family protein [Bacteroidetes bacterium QS_7_67_15]|nr:MAG: thioredoxin family protein [Bacteroidetes bacterium QS_7_67_15]